MVTDIAGVVRVEDIRTEADLREWERGHLQTEIADTRNIIASIDAGTRSAKGPDGSDRTADIRALMHDRLARAESALRDLAR